MAEMKTPGPDHPLSFTPSHQRVRALYHGHLIADSGGVVVCQEANYPPVYYFPKSDVEMLVLTRTEHASHCPYKGDATYWTILRDGDFSENGAWSYEEPYPASEAIRGMIAFYPNVASIELYDIAVQPDNDKAMSDYIRHTDSGSGGSQAEHWAPTVSQTADRLP